MAKKQNILIVGPSHPFRGGIAAYSTLLYDAIGRKHNCDFFGLKNQFFSFLYPGRSQVDKSEFNLAREGIQYRLDTYNPFSWITAGRAARKYDTVIMPWWVVFWAPYYRVFIAFAKNPKTKILLLCHNVQDHESSFLSKWGAKCIFKHADQFIVQSESEAKQLQKLLPKKQLDIQIHPHPSYSFYNRNQWTQASARKDLGLKPDEHIALFFGYIRPYKGVNTLIDAMARLKNKLPKLKLLVVGEIWKDDPSYQKQVTEEKLEHAIQFIDDYVPAEEIEKYFKASDFVTLPYHSGTGSGVLEIAFGMHRPVVASDIPAFNNAVKTDQNGLLVTPESSDALAKSIEGICKNQHYKTLQKNLKRVDPNASWDQLVTIINI